MYTGMMHLHSTLRYVLLILLIVTIYKAYTGYKQGRAFTAGDDKLSLYTMIAAHLQLLIGLYMYFASPTVQNALADMKTAGRQGVALPGSRAHIGYAYRYCSYHSRAYCIQEKEHRYAEIQNHLVVLWSWTTCNIPEHSMAV